MTWFKVDDALSNHPKARAAGLDAMGLWVVAGAFSGAYLTEGVVPRWYVESWPEGGDLADRLVRVGLWITHVDGWEFHDWLEWNPSRDQVEAERKANRERQARYRDKRRSRDVTPPVSDAVSNGVSDEETDAGTDAATNGAPSRPDPSLVDRSAVTAQEARSRADGTISDESATLRAGLGTIMRKLGCDEVWASKTAARFDALASSPIRDYDAYYGRCIDSEVKTHGLASLLPTPVPSNSRPSCRHGIPLVGNGSLPNGCPECEVLLNDPANDGALDARMESAQVEGDDPWAEAI